MAEGGGNTESPAKSPPSESSGRWDFLKKIKSTFWRKNPGRRDLLKTAVIGGAAVAVAGGAARAAAEQTLAKPSIERVYKIGNDEVELSGNLLLPKDGKVADESEIALFLVGAPMRAKASVTWDTPKGLAEASKVKAYTLDARPRGIFDQNSIGLEVEAIRRFLEELSKQGVKKVTIFGHSIGARKAIDLVTILEQQNPDLKINGLVLSNPMGFYEQEPDLLKRWQQEADNEAKIKNPKVVHQPMIKIGAQLAGSMAADVRQTGLGYKKWVEEQFEALNTVDPNLSQVKAPTVLLLGSEDLLAEVNKVLPEEEINRRLPQTSKEGQAMRQILKNGTKWDQLSVQDQAQFGNKDAFVRLQREQIAQRGRARNEYIKERMPSVENLQVIVATKYATHVGFGVERGDQTHHVVSKIFDRLRRSQNTPSKAA